MRERRKHWYEIRAWADGWDIEYLSQTSGDWIRISNPAFMDNDKYRVVPDSEGWLPWYGGECPVDGDVEIEYRMKHGDIEIGLAKNIRWSECNYSGDITAYRIIKEADPYAELKAAAKDPTKQIRLNLAGEDGTWLDLDANWTFMYAPNRYEIRDKPKTKKVKLLAFVWEYDGDLVWRIESKPIPGPDWKRVPSEDKEIEVEE